jgi:hypothetical protein
LFTLLIVAMIGVTAIAVDLTTFSQEKQELYNTTDASALAGVSQLPEDYLGAANMARDFAIRNNPDLVAADIEISYRCVVGDRNGDGQPDPEDVPAACDPGPDTPITAPPFICDLDLCYAPCFPATGDVCNTIVVGGSETVDFSFAGVIGISDKDASVASAACVGFCGEAPTGPLDVALILDRTDSMSRQDLQKAKNAAKDVLRFFNPNTHHIALATLRPGDPDDVCDAIRPEDGGNWLVVPLSNDYQNPDGDLNGSSDLEQTINCITRPGISQYQTNLGSPINDEAFRRADSVTELIAGGRPEAKKGIILLSDGQANQPRNYTDDHCWYAARMAQVAKDAEIEIFTIGFGVESGAERCADDRGPYRNNARATALLADMASGGADDNCRSGNTEAENTDGDNFFCEPKSGDLSELFIAAAAQLASDAVKLIYLPEDA